MPKKQEQESQEYWACFKGLQVVAAANNKRECISRVESVYLKPWVDLRDEVDLHKVTIEKVS